MKIRFFLRVFLIICLLSYLNLIDGFKHQTVIANDFKDVELQNNKWFADTKEKLENLIAENAGKNKKVIFDFDNTLICRDIGEATFAAIAEDNKISLKKIINISPSFKINKKIINLNNQNLTSYYEYFLLANQHQTSDNSPYSNAYVWVIQIMEGMTPADIVYYTEKAYAKGTAQQDMKNSNQETKINGYYRPFFYVEMVDLVGLLLKNGFDIYVISASNVWSIRWMVLKNLYPMIQAKYGKNIGIAPDHILGISTLLKDKRNGKLYKDFPLVKEDKNYANLNIKELANYELTNQVVYPITTYYGKVANIFQYISWERPFLVAGDSPGDFAMLNWAENRLWITRLEKFDYQQKIIKQIKNSLSGEWMLQPVITTKSPGFVSSSMDLNQRLKVNSTTIKKLEETIKLLKDSGQLNFN